MPNFRRYYENGGTFFLTICLKDRQSNLLTDRIDMFRRAYKKVQVKWPFTTHAACILPDHFHVLWTMPDNDTIYPTRIRLLKTYFTKSLEIPSPWQRGYWEHLIRDDNDLENAVNYIHENPLKHGLVKNIEDWPYSTWHKSEY
jgi:putative transposase